MGAIFTGTFIFALLGFAAYFLVSAVYRNDKDSQAFVISHLLLLRTRFPLPQFLSASPRSQC